MRSWLSSGTRRGDSAWSVVGDGLVARVKARRAERFAASEVPTPHAVADRGPSASDDARAQLTASGSSVLTDPAFEPEQDEQAREDREQRDGDRQHAEAVAGVVRGRGRVAPAPA